MLFSYIKNFFQKKRLQKRLILSYLLIMIPCLIILSFCLRYVQDFAFKRLQAASSTP